jgi:hypothetical protein
MQGPSRALVSLCLLPLLAHAAGAAPDAPKQEALDALTRYESEARALVASLESGGAGDVDGQARSLMALSRTILGEFAVTHPVCGPYFHASFGLEDRLGAITSDEVEREYHADAKLPAAPPFCYHAKDLFVHPATVLVLRREGSDPTRQAAEIQEAAAHLAIVRTLLLLPAESKPG